MLSRLRTVVAPAALVVVLGAFAGRGYCDEPRGKPAQAKPAATRTEPPREKPPVRDSKPAPGKAPPGQEDPDLPRGPPPPAQSPPPGAKLPQGDWIDLLKAANLDKDLDAEKKAFEGTWRVVACLQGGRPLRPSALSQFTFKANRLAVIEQSERAEYEYTLDVAKRPKQLVLVALPPGGERKPLRVAYSLEGDRLVICFDSRPAAPAPNALESKAGDDRFLATLKRLPRPVADQGAVGRGARPGTAELVRRIEWPGIHVYHTAFSSDSRLYLGGGDSGTLRVWDVATGQQLHELPSPVGFFTPDGKHVLGYSEKTIYLFDLSSGKEVRTWEPSQAVVGLAIAPEGKRFVSGHADNLLRLWDLAGDKELRGFEYPAEPGEDRGPLAGSQEGYSAHPAVFSPDGKQIVSASPDKRIRVWDADTGKCLRVLETFKYVGRLGDHHLILDASFLPGGRQIAGYVWGTEKTLVVWDAATGQEVRRFDLDHQKDLAISPDGRWFITAHEDCTVRLRDLTTGEEIHRFELADVYAPRGLAFSPDGRYALCGSHRGWVYLWRLPKSGEKAPRPASDGGLFQGPPQPPVPPQPVVPPRPYVIGKLDPADVAAIVALVQTMPENVDKRILRIEVEKADQVEVWTGVQPSPKAGRGSAIRLKKVGGKWKIVGHGHWIS